MNQSLRATAFAVLVACCAPAAHAVVAPGKNFDGTLSLIYNQLTGDVFLENSPLPNPSVQSLKIESSSGLLLPSNLNLPALTPVVTIDPGTDNFLIDVTWSGGNFLGTGSYLGQLLAPGIDWSILELDLTVTYAPGGVGDLIYGSFGQLQSQPILPTAPGGNGFFRFFDVASGQFFDPPTAYGYTYKMDTDSLFTKVGLPLGLGNNFTISSSEGTVFNLPEGGMHEFDDGVSEFTLIGIAPLVDPDDPAAFPLYLEFSTSTAGFSMTALTVPEPGSLTLVGMAISGIGALLLRRRLG